MSNQHCEICYQLITDRQKNTVCPACDQDFHQSCLREVVRDARQRAATVAACPMCRVEFTSQFIYNNQLRALPQQQFKLDPSVQQTEKKDSPTFHTPTWTIYSFRAGILIAFIGAIFDSLIVIGIGVLVAAVGGMSMMIYDPTTDFSNI